MVFDIVHTFFHVLNTFLILLTFAAVTISTTGGVKADDTSKSDSGKMC